MIGYYIHMCLLNLCFWVAYNVPENFISEATQSLFRMRP